MEKFLDCQSKKLTCMIFKALGEVALYFHIKCDLVVYMFLSDFILSSYIAFYSKLEWLSRDNLSSPPFALVTYRHVKN